MEPLFSAINSFLSRSQRLRWEYTREYAEHPSFHWNFVYMLTCWNMKYVVTSFVSVISIQFRRIITMLRKFIQKCRYSEIISFEWRSNISNNNNIIENISRLGMEWSGDRIHFIPILKSSSSIRWNIESRTSQISLLLYFVLTTY